MMRRVVSGAAPGCRAAASAVHRQARHKPLQPFKWPNEKIMRVGMRTVNLPYEVKNNPDEVKGDFGLVVVKGGHITERQLENAMLALKQKYRLDKHYNITLRDEHQLLPLTRRPQGARQGKGLGDTIQWVMKVRAGTVLFDVVVRGRHHIDQRHIQEFFTQVRPMLGVQTMPVMKGLVTDLDDFTFHNAQPYMDQNYWRRHQDIYPDKQHLKAYNHRAKFLEDAPFWNPVRPTRHWYPVYSGKDYPHRQQGFIANLPR